MCIAWLFEAVLRDFKNTYYQYDFSTNLLCIVIYGVGVLGMQEADTLVEFKGEKVADRSGAPIKPDEAVVRLIDEAMTGHRLYLNPELTLAELAAFLNLPAKTVSFNINAAYNKPFNTYINSFRVDEIKRRLQTADLQKFTLLSIAFDSGFNSKTSFNRIFKEFTGTSPSDFIKK